MPGLKLQIYDPKQLLLEQSALTHFDSFGFEPDSFPNAKADQRFELLTIPPASHAYGEVLLQNSELSVFEHTNHYIIVFHPMQNLYEAHMTKDGSYVRIYCKPEHSDTAAENLFHAIRLFFLFLAQKTDYLRFILHLFCIIKKHGCSLVIPELENLHILLFGTRFFKLHI